MVEIQAHENFRIEAQPHLAPLVDDGKIGTFFDNLPPPIDPMPDQFETEMRLMLSRRPMTLQGMIFAVHFSGDDLFKVQVNNLDEANFNQMKNWLEDTMTTIDAKHKKRSSVGASSWEGMGTRLRNNELDASDDMPARARSIKVRILPRSFSNALARIKEGIVYERLRSCICIEQYSSGRFKQCIYLLPYSEAAKMMVLVEEANKQIDQVNREIQEYIRSDDFHELHAIFTHYHAEKVVDDKDWLVPHIRFDVTPLALNPQTVMDMVKPEDIKDAALKKKYDEGIAMLQKELETRSREMTEQVLVALKAEIDRHVKNIVVNMKTNPDMVKADLAALRSKASSIGLEALAETVLDPLTLLIDNPKKAGELFGVQALVDLPAEVDDRLLSLIRSL